MAHAIVALSSVTRYIVARTSLTASELVRLSPQGAYTTARTSACRTRVFEFETHVERTAKSCALMGVDGKMEVPPSAVTDAKALRPLMLRAFSAAVGRFSESLHAEAATSSGEPQEVKLTLLLTWGEAKTKDALALIASHVEGVEPGLLEAAAADAASATPPFVLLAHATALPKRRAPPIRVMVQGAPRKNAQAKDSEWVRERAALEAAKPADVEEVVLCDDEHAGPDGGSGALMEGTQTNFLAMMSDGSLRTAGLGVLEGTVRRLVLELCPSLGIPVSLTPPLRSQLRQNTSATPYVVRPFVSSTSRLLLPVDEMRFHASSGTPEWTSVTYTRPGPEASSTAVTAWEAAARLEAAVAAEVERHSSVLEGTAL